jgi:hypothetical protein
MTNKTNTLRRATALGLAGALALAGTAGAEGTTPKPLLTITKPLRPQNATTQQGELHDQLSLATDVGNAYLDRSAKNKNLDGLTGGLLLLSGFYGAAVTAFNPAPKNLKAAILATGTATGLNTGLKFRDRSRAYRQGHRAMACLVETGEPLLRYQPKTWNRLVDLRGEAARALKQADVALIVSAAARGALPDPGTTAETQILALVARLDGQVQDAQRKTLEERAKVLAGLDKKLAEEEGAFVGAPARAAQVRRLIIESTDKALDAAAPDYAAAVKAMGETAEPEAAPSTGGATPESVAASADVRSAVSLVSAALTAVEVAIRNLEAGSPSQATKAHAAMGECIPKAG